jgi:hypothetical protein
MEENLHPAYLQGLAASNRFTDARGEVHRLLHRMPPESFMSYVSLGAIWSIPVSVEEFGAYL